MKIYFFRHQAAGVLYEYPFTITPSEAQLADIKDLCVVRYGAVHKKTGEPYWTRIEELEAIGPGEFPKVTMPDTSTVEGPGRGTGELKALTAQGIGNVKNPK